MNSYPKLTKYCTLFYSKVQYFPLEYFFKIVYNDAIEMIIEYLRRIIIMAYVISDSCVSCGTCESECPVSAISQGDSQYVIDADACISSGTCAGVCPTGAINEG